MKRLVIALALVLGSLFLAAPAATAEAAGKVYVCKYIVTPGTGEILQKSGKLIHVSASAVDKDKDGNVAVGDEFADGQFLSVVVALDGDPVPDESICVLDDSPTPEEPTDNPTPGTPGEGVLPNTGGSDGWLLLVAGLLGTAGVATLTMRRFIKE